MRLCSLRAARDPAGQVIREGEEGKEGEHLTKAVAAKHKDPPVLAQHQRVESAARNLTNLKERIRQEEEEGEGPEAQQQQENAGRCRQDARRIC